ncbi:carbon-phosphorus lyase core complex subunit PhnG [Pararobbsia alpina]|uniref:phosphonate C-P lyase system protein PhnG n=1 Tax=Pararobbsia alpina TaxID=621374 RepID=UPI0039A6A7FA
MNPPLSGHRQPQAGPEHEPDARSDSPQKAESSSDATAERREWLSLLARASRAELDTALQHVFDGTSRPAFDWLRVPETGLAMVRGRMGGTGDPFNTGEATVTRATLRLKTGTVSRPVGVAYQLGRDKRRAELAALCDALLQTAEHAPAIRAHVLGPVSRRLIAQREARRAEVAATRVEFFTMVRGE